MKEKTVWTEEYIARQARWLKRNNARVAALRVADEKFWEEESARAAWPSTRAEAR